ncbi:hypothetical protein [Thermomonas fusca]
MTKNSSKEKILLTGMWSVLGLAMLFCWSLTVHNWTKSRLAKGVPSEVANGQPNQCPQNYSASTQKLAVRVNNDPNNHQVQNN